MFRNLSIRKKLIIGVLFASMLPLAIAMLYIVDNTEKWLYQDHTKNALLLLQQTAGHVDHSLLENAQNLANMIAADERLVNVDESISQYINYDPKTFSYSDSESERQITQYFKTIHDTHDLITFVSFGTEFGGYIEYPLFKPSGSYDPRRRPWYVNAVANENTLISEPYETQMTKELVISVDSVVRKESETVGVVSLTISLDNIMHDISRISYGKTGSIFILSPSGNFINSPNHPDWLMENADEKGLIPFSSIREKNYTSYEGQLNSIDKVFYVYISPLSGWQYVAVMDKSELLEHSRSLTGILWTILLIVSLIILSLILILSSYISNPILLLSQIIKRMAVFEFTGYEKKNFQNFTEKNDEIGEIARALQGMERNFIELIENLDIMDDEIKGIRIDDAEVKRLNLSSDNPFNHIALSINGLLEKVTTYVEKIKDQNDQIDYLADHDPLTNLPNRRSFHRKLENTLSLGESGTVILLDMDNFKSINDSLGHVFGDKVLKIIADKLISTVSADVFVSRFGGDEFLILHKSNESVQQYIQILYSMFDEIMFIDENEIKVEFSMGVSRFPEDADDIEHIIMYADLALYDVKNTGKNGYAFFNDTMASHLQFKLDIKSLLHTAMDYNGFKMVYQPQIRLSNGEIVGFEALLRFKDYSISPSDFIRIAEENGLIIPIGRLVTSMVIQQVKAWRQKGIHVKPIAINFSGLQINDMTYSEFLIKTLTEYEVSTDAIYIEITEHIFLENKDAAVRFLNGLRQSGIKIAVDDFGAEYSSLSYLASLPIDILKFDRELIVRLLDDKKSDVMAKLIAFVHSLNLSIIAEGIETRDHALILKASGCDVVQGYYFSKPIEAHEVERIHEKKFFVD